jgi:hypothetical protein
MKASEAGKCGAGVLLAGQLHQVPSSELSKRVTERQAGLFHLLLCRAQ